MNSVSSISFTRRLALLAGLAVAGLAGCATQSPVIYPSDAERGSEARLETDMAACADLANANGAGPEGGERVLTDTATNSAIGAGAGAVGGAIAGNVGGGALIGAVTAGVGTLLRSAFKSSEPTPVHKQFVAHCLRERGHTVVGWQ